MVPRQNQSGSSILRFKMVTAAHSVIKYSDKLKRKYLSIVKRRGKNLAVVAIAHILIGPYTQCSTVAKNSLTG